MFGSHLSIAGSMTNALLEAELLGLDCVQVFTKNQQQWKCKPFEQAAIDEWRSHTRRLNWHAGDDRGHGRVVSHASYLSNLASPNPELYNGSIELMRIEIERAEQLGIRLLVFHPGAYTTSTPDEGIGRIAAACARLIKETSGSGVVLCFENVAGQGSTIGRTFEELAQLHIKTAEAVGGADRLGFCIDTAHAHAAGYDLSTRAGAKRVLDELEAKLPKGSIRCLHINDSKTPCGSRVDRHAHIGEGTIGLAGFAAVVNHPSFAAIPKVMETPKEEKKPTSGTVWDQINAQRLRALLGSTEELFAPVSPIGPAAAAPKKRAGESAKPAPPTKRKGPSKARAAKKVSVKANGKPPGGSRRGAQKR
ncbi:MAG TPA: deoxyribonuclease IV [Phycisphaerales bacterium]|nr:deoxyribonuclease IV [Phycisphaerales bacterium]